MAITHFRISELPTRGQLTLSAVPVTLNQSIAIGNQSNLQYENQSGFKAQSIDQFKYQVSEDEVTWSNEGVVLINDYAATGTPGSVNDVLDLSAESQSTNLKTPTDYLNINVNTDRIKIVGFTTNAEFAIELNGAPLSAGSVIFVYDLENLVFKNFLGGGTPYQEIFYQCGNHLGFDATVYTLTINVNVLAQLAFSVRTTVYTNQVISNISYARTIVTDRLIIIQGDIEKTANGEVVINSPMFAVNANNSVSLNDESQIANGTYAFNQDFDNEGKLVIDIEHSYLDMTGAGSSSQADYTLLNVDGNAAKVDLANDSYSSSVTFLGLAAGAVGAVTSYRSIYENDGNIYGGYLDGATPVIKRNVNGVVETASGVTSLETDWDNRLNLTYS